MAIVGKNVNSTPLQSNHSFVFSEKRIEEGLRSADSSLRLTFNIPGHPCTYSLTTLLHMQTDVTPVLT